MWTVEEEERGDELNGLDRSGMLGVYIGEM